MKSVPVLAILGVLLASVARPATAASSPSDWPSLGADAAQSNYNRTEHVLSSRNVLKLKARWSVAVAEASYPIVVAGKVYVPTNVKGKTHITVYDASSGKQSASWALDASGGVLGFAGRIYVAGKTLRDVDPATGNKTSNIAASPTLPGGVFVDPVADAKLLITGYAGIKGPNRLYAIDPASDAVRWKAASLTAHGTLALNRVLTQTPSGSGFFDETDGRTVASKPTLHSDWFAGAGLVYTVASAGRHPARVFAYTSSGKAAWSRVVAPYMIASGWPHAVSDTRVIVQSLKPQVGVESLEPHTGKVTWFRPIADVQRIAIVNGMVLVLTYNLGQPVRLVALQATSGKIIGAIVLSSGYYAFSEPNELMVADGMVFIRVVGPGGSRLVALAPTP